MEWTDLGGADGKGPLYVPGPVLRNIQARLAALETAANITPSTTDLETFLTQGGV